MNQLANLSALDDVHAAVAGELAMNLFPAADVLKRHGLTTPDLARLSKNPVFVTAYRTFKQEWESATNSKERLRIKAALIAEERLLELDAIFMDQDLNPTARLEAFKQITNLADVLPKKDVQETGTRFNLTLNLGGEAQPVVIEANTEDVDDEDQQDL
jgi:hypothetical protein